MIRKIAMWLSIALALTMAPIAAQEVLDGSDMQMYDLLEFRPPAFYEAIYHMMERCTGVQGDYKATRWYYAQALVYEDGNVRSVFWGVWFKGWGWPAIVLDREHVFDGRVVGHEVIHALYGGPATMDVARKCGLEWENLSIVTRDEPNEAL